MKARVISVLLRVWDLVWKTLVVVGLLVSIISGSLSAASATGAINTNVKQIIDLPANLDHWLEVTGAAAEKYCAKGGCP